MLFLIVIFTVSNVSAQNCEYWQTKAGVDGVEYKGVEVNEKDVEKIIEGIECLLRLEGFKTDGAFSGAAHYEASQILPRATVEICALYYISKLFYGKYDYANGIALRYKNYEENRTLNSDEAVKAAYESYRRWFERVKRIGVEEARKQKLDLLEGSGVRWY